MAIAVWVATGQRYRGQELRHGEQVRKLSQTTELAIARRARNKIEAFFSELRSQIQLRKVRLRGLRHAKERFTVAATA